MLRFVDNKRMTGSGRATFDAWTFSVGATAAALSCAITFVGRDPSVAFAWLDLFMILFAAMPYIAAICLSEWSDFLRLWSQIAVTTYGTLDIYIRAEVTWFPQSSTAGIAMLTLPFIGAPVAFVASAGAAGILSGARSAFTNRK
jgi:hypothetical protein